MLSIILKNRKYINVPNSLTIFRIFLIFLLVPCFYLQTELTRMLAIFIFFIACITDYLDGYFARTLKQTTRFGQLFDPIADKMLIATTLLLMAGFDFFSKFTLIPALIILCREVFVSGLREFVSVTKIKLPVTRLAKYKTAFQMISIGLLLIADAFPYQKNLTFLGEITLWIAGVLTIITGYQYFKQTFERLS
ncbi:MAG: CDP-diacylglycerol--glycerol-3-phosphate 3-phosphatidyltransferase [Proteobacteria bacterium]|nr:CDP-diacylglycerol--glycerol-3-phosphate 3-phosphatidyltransferase [Pseudomonadota bacterium]